MGTSKRPNYTGLNKLWHLEILFWPGPSAAKGSSLPFIFFSLGGRSHSQQPPVFELALWKPLILGKILEEEYKGKVLYHVYLFLIPDKS